ncbi:MAG: hypothetical protein HY588_02000 [Candidatus Omnitrophica bacterium]|nr:hypothetical protein [Candidatus Omnitrophota bacterium]
MLLGKKIKTSASSVWAVILDQSPNEFSKNRAVEKLAEIFSLSIEEARDLVENTPIILLDHLPFDLADKIRDYFAQANVNCSVTNDTFSKRKCFRAVWPEPPNLAYFLEGTRAPQNGDFASTVSPAPEAPIHPLEPIREELPLPAPDPASNREQAELRELTQDLQKENEILHAKLGETERSIRAEMENFQNSEIEKLRSGRNELESVLAQLKGENKTLRSKIEELKQNIDLLKRQNIAESASVSSARAQLAELKTQLEHFRAEYTRSQNAARRAQSEAGQFQAELSEAQKAVSDARSEVEDLKRMLSQAQANAVQLKEETERIRVEIQDRYQTQISELDEWKRKANDWSASYFKVIKENEFLRARQSEELESLRVRNQQLGAQLEQAQRQIRDFVGQLEQQEVIQKRMKAASELAAQEAHLKTLVEKQQTLETEIRAREEEMKQILAEQEAAEQEIVKSKQAQKYLIEQAKLKEKSRFIRPPKNSGPSISSRQDPVSENPAID